MSVVIEAQRPSACANCNYGIRVGQRIRLDFSEEYEGEWVHALCPAAPTVCACLCGAV